MFRYFTPGFWKMTIGFVIIILVGSVILIVASTYEDNIGAPDPAALEATAQLK